MDFASLRAKAQQAASKGQQSATDFYKTHKNQAPLRPAATHTSSSSSYSSAQASRLQPPARSSALSPPTYAQQPSSSSSGQPRQIDWINITQEEKEAFFSLLDQYFDRQRAGHSQASGDLDSAPPPAPERARPASRSADLSQSSTAFTSFPPPAKLASAAADFAEYFKNPSSWQSKWYAGGQRMPPVLDGRDDFTFAASMSSLGSNATLIGSVLFSDLSMANYSVAYDTSGRSAPKAQVAILNRPAVADASLLVAAYEMHSEAIAQFAEQAIASGQPVGHGECWDLADQALKSLEQYDIPKVVPSLSRCHGHLIYEGKALPSGQEGRWRGGDTQIRRGDIVEWRKVTIAEVGMPSTAWSTLGNPDHTAVVLADAVPSAPAVDGGSIPPSSFQTLEVAEQSQGQRPKRSSYDLTRMSAGEMWIYRPIGIETYLGRDMTPEWPALGMQTVVSS